MRVLFVLYVLYCSSPWDIDLYVGILTETVLGESMTGPTAACLIGIQMEALKYGDIFWYETRIRSSDNERLGFTDGNYI